MESDDYKHKELTESIICCFFTVYNTLGYGFLEKVYENALVEELSLRGLNVKAQVPVNVFYKNKCVGNYFCDLLVDDKVIVELKAAKKLMPDHEAQLLNYLKATKVDVGLLLNFGTIPEVKRRVL